MTQVKWHVVYYLGFFPLFFELFLGGFFLVRFFFF